MKRQSLSKLYVAVIGFILLLSGCFGGVSKPSAFYMLSSEKGILPVSQVKTTIGVWPVDVPEFLDKPQIVLNETDTQMHVSETNRWSEPLSLVTQRVLIEDLQQLLPNAYVQTKGYDDNAFKRLIEVEVNSMTGRLSQEAGLSVWWIVKNSAGSVIVRKRFDKTLPLTSNSYADYVKVQSQLWRDLAREIATQIVR